LQTHNHKSQSLSRPEVGPKDGLLIKGETNMATLTNTNGSSRATRKTLSSQIDRLDAVLDGLADNLDDAVAGVVKKVVGQVVREAVEEAVRQTLARVPAAQPNPPPPPPRQPSLGERCRATWAWIKRTTTRAASAVGQSVCRLAGWSLAKTQQALGSVTTAVLRLLQSCHQGCARLTQLARSAWAQCKVAGSVLAVGVGAGLGGYMAGPVVASLVSGVASALLTAGSMAVLSLCRWLSGTQED
jgi:hypothetical protein